MEVRVDVMQVEGETKFRMPSRSGVDIDHRMVQRAGLQIAGLRSFRGEASRYRVCVAVG
jgi:hypothetical protein